MSSSPRTCSATSSATRPPSSAAASASGGAVNAGDGICVAQAQHGSAPDIAGQGIANPVSLVLSAGMLLDWHGARSDRPELRDAWRHLDRAVTSVVADPATRTRDLGGSLGTADFTGALIDALTQEIAHA